MAVVQQQKNDKVDGKKWVSMMKEGGVYFALSFHRGNVRDFE